MMELVDDSFMKDATLRREEAEMDLLDFAEQHLFSKTEVTKENKEPPNKDKPKLNSSKTKKTSNPQLISDAKIASTNHNGSAQSNNSHQEVEPPLSSSTPFRHFSSNNTCKEEEEEPKETSLLLDEEELSVLESLSQRDMGNNSVDEDSHLEDEEEEDVLVELSHTRNEEQASLIMRKEFQTVQQQQQPLTDKTEEEDQIEHNQSKKRRVLPSWCNEAKQQQLEEEKLKKLIQSKDALRELGSQYSDEHPKLFAEKEHIEIKTPPTKGRVICFDLETTGFATTDQIVEIGAVEIVDGKRTGLLFQSFCKPTVPIHSLAEEAHGLSEAFLSSQPSLDEVLPAFIKFVGNDATLVAHNISFDMRMLYQELDRLNLFLHPDQKIFCTQKYFRVAVPGISYSLSSAASYFGVDRTFHRKTHGALLDSEILAQVFLKLAALHSSKRGKN